MALAELNDPLLQGADPAPGLVAADLIEGATDRMALYFREGDVVVRRDEPFLPFAWLSDPSLLIGFEHAPAACRRLAGGGALAYLAEFATWKQCLKARAWMAKRSGAGAGSPQAPFFVPADPVHQYLLRTGRTMFKEMAFDNVRRMQIDIECATADGYEFCNAERDEDRIIAIGMADNTGWQAILSGVELDEPDLLRRFVHMVRERDPDIIEGHNIFNFDLPYIAERARRHKVKLTIGRDGTTPAVRASRFSVGERVIGFSRFDVMGRHVVDTYFLVQAYDISRRSLAGYGLKEVAVHFGLAAPDRTYVEGSEISAVFRSDPARILRYVADDVRETRGVADVLAPVFFIQARFLPYAYQDVCVRGNATKIDALLVREYLRQERALPLPVPARQFAGGYADIFYTGVVNDVHHCDVRSLYPSLMLARRLGPRSDDQGVFLRLLEQLRTFRLDARARMSRAQGAERDYLDTLQLAFKVFINSFYGYLGFEQGHFNDYEAAEKVTADGRELLKHMIEWLRVHDAQPIEIDTDGIYFVPPPPDDRAARENLRNGLRASLPPGIEIEFDGEYRAMFSYRMKNYALLDDTGEIIIKGAALKSRGLEPFQRDFMKALILRKLEGREDDITTLRDEYAHAIITRQWPISMLAKTETLQDAPATYEAKRSRGGRSRNAAYELALKSGRVYRAGDQVSHYVAGDRKNVSVYASARLVSEWDPARRDENVAYYLAKLEALYQKFTGMTDGAVVEDDGQMELPGADP